MIENCESYVTVTTSGKRAGAFVGYAQYGDTADTGNLIIRNCVNNNSVSGSSMVGGILGYAGSTMESVTIENCVNKAQITGTSGYVGGIIGQSENKKTKITNCVNMENIAGTSTVGGIAGSVSLLNTEQITNCYYLSGSATDLLGNTGTYDTDSCSACVNWTDGPAVSDSVTTVSGTYNQYAYIKDILNAWVDYAHTNTPSVTYYKWKVNDAKQLILY